jgi:hypothetical protein
LGYRAPGTLEWLFSLFLACLGVAVAHVSQAAVNPADFVRLVDNPYYPLIPGTTFHFESSSDRLDINSITHETKVIQGVTCTVVHNRAILEGVLSEESFDWFAQDKDGNVWFFGEDSREFDQNGVVIGTQGSWEAGKNGAEVGLIMPAHPQVNQSYRQERAPGVAEDMGTVLALDAGVEVAFGSFTNCIRTRDISPLRPGEVEENFYAPGIGLIRSVQVQGGSENFELGTITREPVNPADFVTRVDHSYYPLNPGAVYRYEGTKDGKPVIDEFVVLQATKLILGVTCTVVRNRTTVNGLLEEDNLDWFAQDKDGNVWYFGEDSKKFDNGVVISTEGSWEAGVNGADPGIIMPSRPKVNQTYLQERAPGTALDMATVLALDAGAELALGPFTNCIITREFSPLHPGKAELTYYAPGIGFILSVNDAGGERLELVSVQPQTNPRLQIIRPETNQITIGLNGFPGQTYRVETSIDLVSWSPLFTNTLSGNRLDHSLTNASNNPRQFFRAVGQ